jgi:HEPN domain-containing protein
VELSLKAALRFAGIEAPKWHDVGPVLRCNTQRFPEWFRSRINELASVSRRLRREREPSMYGDEESGLSPDELYTREDALTALTDAKKVYKLCIKLLKNACAVQ